MILIEAEDVRFPLPEIGNAPEETPSVTPDCSCSQLPTDSINPALIALAMGFVPVQAWEEPYELDLALSRGTIFPSLDKPFLGEEAVPR